jgi:hypothetical protein
VSHVVAYATALIACPPVASLSHHPIRVMQVRRCDGKGHAPTLLYSDMVLRECTHKSRWFGNRWLPQTTCAGCAGCSGGLLPPSPPAEKSTARQDQARQSSADDGAGYGRGFWGKRTCRYAKNCKRGDGGRRAPWGDAGAAYWTASVSCQTQNGQEQDKLITEHVSFPKIISGRIGGAARTRSGWRQ